MKSNWWKILGILILIYTVIVGMSVPLKPGIERADSISMGSNGNNASSISSGENHVIKVIGYNTNYKDNTNKAWLRLDTIGAVAATKFETISETEANVHFTIPTIFPARDTFQLLSMVIYNKEDGPSILPDAFSIRTNQRSNSNLTEWTVDPITNITDKPGMQFPYRSVLNETIRNTFFHIPLWFSMFILLLISIIYSGKYLKNNNIKDDIIASSLVNVAVLFGILGIITGSIWARFTWGTFWTTDVKLNMSTVAMLIYVASLILRSSINDVDRRAKLSASYNIFAFAALIPLVFVIPRLTDSLHPGNGGNPALGGEDMENTLRMVFYPAIIGFTLLGLWMTSILIRYESLKDRWLSRK
ncbi:MAG: cytochrome c biogenesis protein CcsA [Saprospiraceae bacterium]|nr:cytochrome c biogenesis protein CcsA [Saprospiraceae bacterium]